jgi:hypothetical protein
MMRCKKKSRHGSKGRRQTSMSRGFRSWFKDLINIWTMPATMLKNKVTYTQFIHSVAFVNSYFPDTPRKKNTKNRTQISSVLLSNTKSFRT